MDDKELDKMAKDLDEIGEQKQEVVDEPDGFVEDKETYVKPDGEITATPKHSAQVIKEEGGAGKWILRGLATILILGLGAGSAWLYTDAQKSRNELNSTKTGLEAARSDAAKLRDQVRSLKITDIKPTDTQQAEKTDKEQITRAVTAKIHAPTAAKNAKVKIGLLKQGTDFSYVSAGVTDEGGGAAYILKKVDGLWVIIFSGQDSVPQETVDTFSIPAEYRTGQ